MRNFIIGLTILFFMLSGIITFKALRIPVKNIYDQNALQGMKSEEAILQKDQQQKQGFQLPSNTHEESEKKATPIVQEATSVRENIGMQEVKQYNDTKETSSEMHKVSKRVVPRPNEVLKHQDKSTDISSKSPSTIIVSDQNTSETIYTIQTGSFNKIERSQKQFDAVAQVLNDIAFNYLRIEQIGRFYSVRVGKFNDHAKADEFFQKIKFQLPSAVILKAYMKDDRILKSYEK